jgi:hypothetical protein
MNQEIPQSLKQFKERPPQPLQKNESAICPHCWFEFLPKDAFFIAEHPDLSAEGDPVLGKTEKLRIPPTEVKVDSKGRFEDPKGWPVVDRACPRCHLQVPFELLEKRPIFLSVAGPNAGGKTYFLTVLLHVLRHQLAANFDRSLDYSDSHELKAFTDLEDKLFNQGADKWTYLERTGTGGAVFNTVKLDGHDVSLPKPFLFSMNPTSTSVEEGSKKNDLFQTFALYDNAGELFELGGGRDSTFRAIEHLGVADAIMFAFDPLQDEKTQSKLIENGNKDVGLKTLFDQKTFVPQDKMLLSVITNAKRLRNLTNSKKINIPLLVCVQKFDVWRKLLPAWARIDSSSIEFIKADDTSGLDIAELNSNSLLIRAFINDISPSFVTMAEANFTSIRFFSVSSFGCSPVLGLEGLIVVRSGNLQPFRVTDPILWFMRRLGLIRAAIKKNQCSNVAEVVSKDSEGFVVKFPDSGKRIKLDWEYAGLLVQDPWNGEDVAIPTQSQIMSD